MHRRLPALLLLPAVVAAGAASAQSADSVSIPGGSKTHGFMFGVHVNGSAIEPHDGSAEHGGGAGARAGYGVSDHLTLFAEGDAANIEYADTKGNYSLVHLGGGARLSFRGPSASLRPFVEGTVMRVGAYDSSTGDHVALHGTEVQLGAGLEYFFSRNVAFDLDLAGGSGRFDHGTINGVDGMATGMLNKVSFKASRLNVGVSFHP